MIHIKRRPRRYARDGTREMHINFDLDEVPDIVRRLATFCVVNRRGSDLVPTFTYLQARLSPPG